jgi:putative membrane protein
MSHRRFTAVLLATSLLAAVGTYAQAESLSRADTSFLKDADQAGRTEIEASGLAQERASNAQIKSFAQQMSTDHAKAGEQLKALAESKGVKLPGEPSLRQKAKLKLLGAMKGDRFDRQYADEIGVAAHEDTVKLFRDAAANAKDADVKAFATKTLPALEHHLGMARDLKQTVTAQSSK